MPLLDKFNNRFKTKGSFKKAEIETYICKHFGNLSYWYFPNVELPGQHICGGFQCGCSHNWGLDEIQTYGQNYLSPEEALIGLILEQTEENQERQANDETPFSNKAEFEELVRRVYGI